MVSIYIEDSRIGLRLGHQMGRRKTIDKRCGLFYLRWVLGIRNRSAPQPAGQTDTLTFPQQHTHAHGIAQPTTDPPNAPTPTQSDYAQSVTPSYALQACNCAFFVVTVALSFVSFSLHLWMFDTFSGGHNIIIFYNIFDSRRFFSFYSLLLMYTKQRFSNKTVVGKQCTGF